ncbi:glutamate-1-semialdehyde aminotransferase [Opitutia bacterium SCGC AG-212-L18]|nr:glutamate-1-semialdehyde aminotransferase [Opitutae bacterium SCGC AG-212-L18]
MQTLKENLFEECKKHIPGGVNSPVHAFKAVEGEPFITESAEGAIIKTTEGEELIDFVGAWGPAIFGHNHPEIRRAIEEALCKGTGYGTPNTYALLLAKKIIELVPSIEKIRMVSSGTEATMSAIRVARGYTGRDKIIKFSGCYHGHSDGLLVKAGSGALTFGNPDSAGVPKSYAAETLVLPFNNLAALEECFDKFNDQIAAVILEPYPANCGLLFPIPNYLKNLRQLCTQHKTVLIFDEVMTGFRVALGGAQEREGICPDLTTFAKIIGGGLPAAAFGGKAEIMDRLSPDGPVYQAGTLSGNPLAMAAGLKSLELLEETMPYENLNKMGLFIKNTILQASKEKGIPMQVPQVGSMFSFFFSEKPVLNLDDVLATKSNYFKQVFQYALNHGVFLPPSPFETCFISAAHQGSFIQQAAEVIYKAVKSL